MHHKLQQQPERPSQIEMAALGDDPDGRDDANELRVPSHSPTRRKPKGLGKKAKDAKASA